MFAIPHECIKILLISADELEIDFCNWPENWVLNMLFIITIEVPFCPISFYISGNYLSTTKFWIEKWPHYLQWAQIIYEG